MHKAHDFSKVIVIGAVIATSAYTISSFVCGFHDAYLTPAFFAFWAVELAALAGIKIKGE